MVGSLKVEARRLSRAPVVAIRVCLRGGARMAARPGLALVTGRLLAEGTMRRGWRELAVEAEARGAALAAFGDFELIGVAIDALAQDAERALGWAIEMVQQPAFPEDRCRLTIERAAAELEGLADQPVVRTGWAFQEQIWAPHPRCRPLYGSAADLERIDPVACRRFHRSSLKRGAIVAVAGAVDPERVRRRVTDLLVPAGDTPAAALGEPPAPAGGPERREVALPQGEQAHVFLGRLTVPRDHPDLPALEALSVVLGAGAGLGGRLPRRLREREGLAYTVTASAAAGAGLDPGRLVLYAGTDPRSVEAVERGAREELERLRAEGLGEGELESARAFLLGREPFGRETAAQWAERMVEAALYDLPLDRPEWVREGWRRLTRERVEAAARRHFDPGGLRVTVGRPAGESAAC